MKTKEMVSGAILIAFSILIPVAFGAYLRILIPPFSATIASHVPVMLAMLVSPSIGAAVGVGSGVGFLMAYGADPLGIMIAARAVSHSVWAYIGGLMIRRGKSFKKTLVVTSVMHAALEVVVILILFLVFGIPLNQGTGVSSTTLPTIAVVAIIFFGTIGHHAIDGLISLVIAKAVRASK